MKNNFLFALTFIVGISLTHAQAPQVIIPEFDDIYSNTVRDLEAGNTDINYFQFRYSFLESEQFIIADGMSGSLDSLEKEMYKQMKKMDYEKLVQITKEMLSIDYTNMMALKILRQTYAMLDEHKLAAQYKAIQFGLLYSILNNGDGETCETAWPVIQISEEYFILKMIDAKIREQAVDRNGGLCDRMEVKEDGEKKTYYFEVSKVFEGYDNLMRE
ncbi:MAG: DUF4919 domain-containing protein [Crocinitomicaceae bacterium]|nr:DUF4919 domain-containing protein [Crocinitomicaceae bacterium]